MRVGVDATSWVNRRGYGRFARNAVGRLVELDADVTYVLCIDEQSAAEAELPAGAEQRRVPVREAPSQAAAAESRRGIGDLLRLSRAVRGLDLDAFLFPSVYTYFPVFGPPTVVGVHDVIADAFPELTLPTRRERALWRLKEHVAVRRARRLFTVSETSRAALAKRFRLDRDRLAIVPEAPDPAFRPRADEQVRTAVEGLGLAATEPFLLYAGGISPHKNVETLLDAYSRLGGAGRAGAARLIVAGDLERDSYLSSGAAVRRRVGELGLAERVLLPGFVPDETLACLYSAATAVVLPSLAEGFGLPAVEAAACGAPVVLSDIPAHRETLGDAALYFPPTDAPQLAGVLERVLGDPALCDSLAERGREAVAGLTWDAAARRLGELVREAAVPPGKG